MCASIGAHQLLELTGKPAAHGVGRAQRFDELRCKCINLWRAQGGIAARV